MMQSEATDVGEVTEVTKPDRKSNDKEGCLSLEPLFTMTVDDLSLPEPVQATVTGEIPAWLTGSLFRNGSGLYRLGDQQWRHLFDGFATLHRWSVKDGRVTYLSKLLDSAQFNKSFAANRLVGGNFGTASFPDPCKNIFQRFFSRFVPQAPDDSANAAVNVVEMGDRLFALTEYPTIPEVDPATLKMIGKSSGTKYLNVHASTAHPHGQKDGTMFYYGTLFNDHEKAYNIIKVLPPKPDEDPLTHSQVVATIPSRWKMNIAYSHSFGISENYFIFLELPFVIDVMKLLTKEIRGEALADAMMSYPEEGILIHVVDRKTGQRLPVTYQAPHGFVFHFINCYEEEDHLIVDVCMSNTSSVKHLYLDSLIKDGISVLESGYARFVLPLNVEGAKIGDDVNKLTGSHAKAVLVQENAIKVEAEKPFDADLYFELPRINYEMVNGLKYNYMYGSTFFARNHSRKVIKLDVVQKTVKTWFCGENYEPSEPVFVPSPGATKEDEGVVLVPIVSKVAESESFLVFLDAESFQEIARATLPADIRINFTLHGIFSSKTF